MFFSKKGKGRPFLPIMSKVQCQRYTTACWILDNSAKPSAHVRKTTAMCFGKDGLWCLCEKPKVHCSALPHSRLYTKSLEETSKNYWKSQRQKHPLCIGAESKLPHVRLRGSWDKERITCLHICLSRPFKHLPAMHGQNWKLFHQNILNNRQTINRPTLCDQADISCVIHSGASNWCARKGQTRSSPAVFAASWHHTVKAL